MNTYAAMLAIILWFVCTFVALAFFVSRINSVKKYTEQAIERANTRTDAYYDSNRETWIALTKRVEKLEESKICVLESSCSRLTDTDEAVNTSLYAITQVGGSTAVVSLTEDELAVIDSFIDWAELDDDFSAIKLDEHYVGEEWRSRK